MPTTNLGAAMALRPSDFGPLEFFGDCRVYMRRQALATPEEAQVDRTRGGRTRPCSNPCDGTTAMQDGIQFEKDVMAALRRGHEDRVIELRCMDQQGACTSREHCASFTALEECLCRAHETRSPIDHWFAQVHVWPLSDVTMIGLAADSNGLDLRAGYADLIHVKRTAGEDGKVTVKVIDIKYSASSKRSHKRQIALYVLYLRNTLSANALDAVSAWLGSVWLPKVHPDRQTAIKAKREAPPSFASVSEGVHQVDFDVCASAEEVSRYLRDTLSFTVGDGWRSKNSDNDWSRLYEDIEDLWRFNPACKQCHYLRDCEAAARGRAPAVREDLSPSFVLPHHPSLGDRGANWKKLFALTLMDADTGAEWSFDTTTKTSTDQQRQLLSISQLVLRVAFPDDTRPPVQLRLPGEEKEFTDLLWDLCKEGWECLVGSKLNKEQLVQLLYLCDVGGREYWNENVIAMRGAFNSPHPDVLMDNVFVFDDMFNVLIQMARKGWECVMTTADRVSVLSALEGGRQWDGRRPSDEPVAPEELLQASRTLLSLFPSTTHPFLWIRRNSTCRSAAQGSSYVGSRTQDNSVNRFADVTAFMTNHLRYTYLKQKTDNKAKKYNEAFAVVTRDTGDLVGTHPFEFADRATDEANVLDLLDSEAKRQFSCTVVDSVGKSRKAHVRMSSDRTGSARNALLLSIEDGPRQLRRAENLLVLPNAPYLDHLPTIGNEFLLWASTRYLTLLRRLASAPGDGRRPETGLQLPHITERFTVSGHPASDAQRRVLDHVCSRAPVTVVWGPPGTGKSATLAAVIQVLRLKCPSLRILVSAVTNNAVEVLAELLRRNGVEGVTSLANVRAYRNDTREGCVVLGTFYAVYSKIVRQESAATPFDVLCIEEASMYPVMMAALVSQLLVPERHKIILAGDLLQLQCIVADVSDHFLVRERQWQYLCGSVLQAFFTGDIQNPLQELSQLHNFLAREGLPDHVVQLTVCFRATPSLVNLISYLYPSGLTSHREQSAPASATDSSAVEVRIVPREKTEHHFVAELVAELCNSQPGLDIFVCCPHRCQRRLIKPCCEGLKGSVRVDTTECMQGAESDVVVLCYGEDAKMTTDFAFQLFRMNVAISRARSKVVLVLDAAKYTELRYQPRGAAPFSVRNRNALPREGWALLQEVASRGILIEKH